MSGDDWLMAFHLLAAFALVGALVGSWAMIAAARSAASPSGVQAIFRPSPLLGALVALGAAGTLVLRVY
jgi:hypothetical protein